MKRVAKKRRRRLAWLSTFSLIVVLDFVVPYTLLKDVASLAGSYAFWAMLTAITIALGYVYMLSWRD